MKTKIGLSAGAYAFFTFLLAIFGGYLPLIIAVGYVLVCEGNEWLRATVAKALFLAICFSLLGYILDFLPDLFGMFNSWAAVFEGNVPYAKLRQIIAALESMISIFKYIFFIILAFMALGMKTLRIGFIDGFVEKHLTLGR
jgi:hypothetical protein